MVRLRLTRMGRKKRPYYRIIAVDKRNRRDGAFIERIGYYHPMDKPVTIKIDGEKALKWLRLGAQPSDTVRSLLRKEGIWYRFKLEKRNLPENQINEMMAEWFEKNTKAKAKPAPEPAPPEPEVAEEKEEKADETPAESVEEQEKPEEAPVDAKEETKEPEQAEDSKKPEE